MTYHYTEKYLLNPQHKITVNLVGLGGTGSQMLTSLARISEALRRLGHPGLHVRAWDFDRVTESNIGRQMFSPADIGQFKAIVLITRVNRFFGLDWEAYAEGFSGQKDANILVTCIDTAAGRIEIGAQVRPVKNQFNKHSTVEPHEQKYYWLDLGNNQKTGQVILGTIIPITQPKTVEKTKSVLPDVIKKFPQLKKIKETDNGPSCSLAEALGRQDLFINSSVVQFGAAIIWKLFREGMIKHHGCFVNLDTLSVTPISIY